jgi:hypothetical protein
LDKIDWDYIQYNPALIDIIRENDKMNWWYLSYNEGIFELDYEAMRENNRELYEELIKEVMKPSRVFKFPDYDYIEELFGE